MKRAILTGAILTTLAGIIVGVLFNPRVQQKLFERGAAKLTSGSNEGLAAIMHDIQDYHISPEEAAKIANEAGVMLLVFYHLAPAPDNFLTRRLFGHGVKEVRKGDWNLAEDGSLYTLPLGSSEIQLDRVSY
jgi:hypothetical protein